MSCPHTCWTAYRVPPVRRMLLTLMEQKFPVRVYYEDTDSMGVVYHANYLRFLERARTELIGSRGPTVQEWARRGFIFPIYSINITFKAPARLCDDLVVVSSMRQTSAYRVSFDQRIERRADGKLLVEAKVDAVCTDLGGTLREFPDLMVTE